VKEKHTRKRAIPEERKPPHLKGKKGDSRSKARGKGKLSKKGTFFLEGRRSSTIGKG